jgi:hypothetical protein
VNTIQRTFFGITVLLPLAYYFWEAERDGQTRLLFSPYKMHRDPKTWSHDSDWPEEVREDRPQILALVADVMICHYTNIVLERYGEENSDVPVELANEQEEKWAQVAEKARAAAKVREG